ncbi:F-box protein CPR1-like protein [Tanacetum coccineum]
MTELGLDIDAKILLRLQVNDLIRCKSVCKSWNSLISSDPFVKSHLKRQHSNEIGDTRIIVCGASSMRLDNRSLSRRQNWCQVIGSSNGLVCLSCYGFDFFVVNPSTREVKELKNLPDYPYDVHIYASGFGYDSSIDDFKVVIGSRCNPNDNIAFNVLELKTNIWRSIVVESDYEYLDGNGILCNGAIYWLHRDFDYFGIVSFDLSKEVFKKISLPKLNDKWNLGTMKDHLCVFRFPNTDLKENDDEIEIWVMRNDQVSWERKLLPPGYDANKTTMNYVPHKNFLSGHVHIWLLEQGSGDPVFVRSIDPSDNEYIHPNYHEHIPLYTYSECNYNYDKHVFVKSLVSPHGMGNENGSCNEERVKRKRQNVISPDDDGRIVKSRRESPVSHNSDGGRAKKTRQSHVSSGSDDDGRKVDMKRSERESHVFHSSDKGRAKIKRQSLVSSDSDDDGRRVERKRRESHVFHSSDKGIAKSRRQSHVSSDSDGDGRRMDRKVRKRDRESPVFHSSDKGRAKSRRQSHVSSDDGRRGERKRRERESHVFHSSDKGRAKSKRQSLVSSDSHGDGRRVDRKRRERDRESLVFHSSNKGIAKSKRQNLVS